MIYNNLKVARKRKGISVKSMIDRLNISQSTYYGWESGEKTIPIKYIVPICSILGVDANYLFDTYYCEKRYSDVLSTFQTLTNDAQELAMRICNKYGKELPYLINLLGMYCSQPVPLKKDEASMCLFHYEYSIKNHCNDVYISSLVNNSAVSDQIKRMK